MESSGQSEAVKRDPSQVQPDLQGATGPFCHLGL
jgi:hypothetical protein